MFIFKNNKTVWVTSLIFLLLIFFTPNSTLGQQDQISPSTDTIGLTQSQRFPEPGQSVSVSVISRVINIKNKQVVWEIDGKTTDSGVGITEISVPVKEGGEITQVRFRVIIENEVVERTLNIRPADVNLLWESVDSYTPPFYQGKALHPGQGQVQVTALPHIYRDNGQIYNINELIYTWSYNGLVFGDDSGRGQNTFTVNTVPRYGNTVTVEIESPTGNTVAEKSITLPISSPELVLYPHSQLFGPQMSTALSDSYEVTTNKEIELIAYPYFYHVAGSLDQSLSYDWRMNNERITPPEKDNVVRLRQKQGVSGEAEIRVNLQDTSRSFPSKTTRVNLSF